MAGGSRLAIHHSPPPFSCCPYFVKKHRNRIEHAITAFFGPKRAVFFHKMAHIFIWGFATCKKNRYQELLLSLGRSSAASNVINCLAHQAINVDWRSFAITFEKRFKIEEQRVSPRFSTVVTIFFLVKLPYSFLFGQMGLLGLAAEVVSFSHSVSSNSGRLNTHNHY